MIIEKISCDVPPHEILGRIISGGARDVVFLDSNGGNSPMSRFSLIFLNPFKKIKSDFDRLAREISEFSWSGGDGNVPAGAAAGYVSYDAGHGIENIAQKSKDEIGWPQMEFGFYDTYILYDHLKGEYFIVSTGLPEKTAVKRIERSKRRLEEFEKIFFLNRDSAYFNQGQRPEDAVLPYTPMAGRQFETFKSGTILRSNFTKNGYLNAINKIKKYIEAGDVYQVNLSQRFYAEFPENGKHLHLYYLYLKIRKTNSVPYGAFINFGGRKILSFSMERFLKINGRDVETRPIKGTMPRGRTPAEDLLNRKKLLKSAKNQAELLMITDLERNDLGRACEYGSVRVKKLYDLEEYATVFHLVSTVTGRLRKGMNQIDCFKSCFPGGSVTGAPKIRSMEIIDELEGVRRGVYCGSIGYFGFNGVSDFNIAIRTIMAGFSQSRDSGADRGQLIFNAGGGITYDSDPEQEYQETLQKIKPLIDGVRS